MPHRFFNPDEAAQYLNLSRREVERLVKDQDIPFEKRGDRPVFRQMDLDAWASCRILNADVQHLAEHGRNPLPGARHEATAGAWMPALLHPDQVDVSLLAKTKPSVLRDMANLAAATGWVYDSTELIQSLEEREEVESTAVSGGLAFLHPRAQQPYRFERSFLALGRAIQPIFFGAPDREPTDLFFLLCCRDGREHLQTLARLCLIAQEPDVLAQLRTGESSAELVDALVKAERTVLRHRRIPFVEEA